MSVTLRNCVELQDGRTATLGEDGTRTCARAWRVDLDMSAATAAEWAGVEATVEAALPVALYDRHPAFPAACVRGVTTARGGKGDSWVCTVQYSSAPFPASGVGGGLGGNGGALGGATKPAGGGPKDSANKETPADQRPADVRVKRLKRTEPLERDALTGAHILNTAGDPFDPPYEVSRSNRCYEISFFRKPKDLDWEAISDLENYCNSQPVELFRKLHPQYTLRVDDITLEDVWEKDGDGNLSHFIKITAALEYDSRTFRRKILNAGRRAIGPDGKPAPIVEADGTQIHDPVPLDENGKVLQPIPADGLLIYRDVYPYKAADLNLIWDGP